jgi:lipoprotein-anchoring transpeptidase ErfK/SrfK
MFKIRLYTIFAILLFYSPFSFPDEVEYGYETPSENMTENYNDINNAFVEPNESDDENIEENVQHIKHYDNDVDDSSSYTQRLPSRIPAQGEKVIIVDPKIHRWGAYSSTGILLRAGLASAGSKWCSDLGRPCRTKAGVFRINSLGNQDCVSSRYPIDVGGASMPYCMYFNGNQALHGSNELAEANISHGCVRMSVQDAEWLRFDFARVGTKVVVKSY